MLPGTTFCQLDYLGEVVSFEGEKRSRIKKTKSRILTSQFGVFLTISVMKGVLDLSAEELGMAAVGIGTAMISNSMKCRPLYSGIQRHIAFGLIGLCAGYFLKNYRHDYTRRKWVVFEDYMARHPEKFEEPPKVYFKDFIQPWTPIR